MYQILKLPSATRIIKYNNPIEKIYSFIRKGECHLEKQICLVTVSYIWLRLHRINKTTKRKHILAVTKRYSNSNLKITKTSIKRYETAYKNDIKLSAQYGHLRIYIYICTYIYIYAFLKIFRRVAFISLFFQYHNITTREANGFKSLRINYWEINQVISKCQMDFLDKTFKKRSKTEKSPPSSNFTY